MLSSSKTLREVFGAPRSRSVVAREGEGSEGQQGDEASASKEGEDSDNDSSGDAPAGGGDSDSSSCEPSPAVEDEVFKNNETEPAPKMINSPEDTVASPEVVPQVLESVASSHVAAATIATKRAVFA